MSPALSGFKPHTPHSAPNLPYFHGRIFSVLLWIHRNGYAESTIPVVGRRLRSMAKDCNLDSPKDVKRCISFKRVKNSYKDNLCDAYRYYVAYHSLTWTRPHYRRESKLPRVPTTESIEKIIACASWKYATIFSVLRDTGMMPEELHRTSLREIELEKAIINAPGCKWHKALSLKLKPKALAMLKRYLKLRHDMGKFPFPKAKRIGEAWRRYRNDLAAKLSEPTFKTIRLYNLRHYFGTMVYHRTRDILLVKQRMGHSKIETTLIYPQLVNFAEDEYTVRKAITIKEATALLESGFEYVTTIEETHLYRKRK